MKGMILNFSLPIWSRFRFHSTEIQFFKFKFIFFDPNSIFFLQKMAVGLAQQLISQLEAKIAAMPNDPDKFLMSVKLQEQADILRVSPIILI